MENFDKDIYSINAVNGIDESVYFNALLKVYKINYIILIDSNSNKVDEIRKKVGDEDFKNHFLEIREIINREGDIEDLIDEVTYYELFKLAYQNILKDLPSKDELMNGSGNLKIVNVYKEFCKKQGVDFNKVLISYHAFKIINDVNQFSPESIENTLKNFSELISLVKKKLTL